MKFTSLALLMVALSLLIAEPIVAQETNGRSGTHRELAIYRSGVNDKLRLLLARDAEELRIPSSLRIYSGPQFQVLRLLMLNRFDNPDVQRDLMTQWLVEDPTTMTEEVFVESLRRVVVGKSETFMNRCVSIGKAVYPIDIEESADAKRAKLLTVDRPDLILSGDTNCVQLNDLATSYSSQLPLGCELFYANDVQRKHMYTSLTKPKSYEDGDQAARALYFLLWLYEPDAEVRESVLLPRIEATAGRSEAGDNKNFWPDRYAHLLTGYDDEVKAARLKELQSLKPPVMTEESIRELREGLSIIESMRNETRY